ncbi:MAG: phosphotransferase [Chloroflexi bacterium]|nr:phosphotransferase [Chloroflexota bacterium]
MNTMTRFDILYFPRPARLSAGITSRLRSADIEPQVVQSVLAHYGLELAAPSRNMPNARRNRNLIVRTDDGPKVLKLYRADWSADTIAYEHSILQFLAGTNFPAPRLLASPGGATRVQLGGRTYCMFEFVEGLNYSWTFLFRPHRMKLMRTAGRTLALLHRQLLDFTPRGSHHLGFVSHQGGRVRDIDWHVRKVTEFKERSRHLDDPNARWLIAHADGILRDMSDLTDKLGGVSLPRTIIHGDFGLHNIIFQGGDHATPMDFELARLEWRLSDLVSCLSKLRNSMGEHDMESITQLLGAYQREFPISDQEWQWFPQVWKYYKLAKAVQYWSSYFETDGPAHKLYLAHDAVNQAGWLGRHPLTVPGLKSWVRWEA